MNRKESFGIQKLSFLDKVIYRCRIHQFKKYCDFDDKIVVDAGCGYNAVFLNYIKSKFSPRKLIAFDIKLNSFVLHREWILTYESDLNKDFSLPEAPDLVLCSAVLEHLDNPQNFLRQVYENLKKWWCLVLTAPSIWSQPVLECLAKFRLIDALEIRDHKQYYTRDKLIRYLQMAWFEKKNIHHHYFEFKMNNFVLVKK